MDRKVFLTNEAYEWMDGQPEPKRSYIRSSVKELGEDGLAEVCPTVANSCWKRKGVGKAKVLKLYAVPPGQRILFWLASKLNIVLIFRIRDRDDDPYGDGG